MPELKFHIDLPARWIDNARTRSVAAAFELARPRKARSFQVLAPTSLTANAGELVYLVGASGSGKSQLLAALARGWPGAVVAAALPDGPRNGVPARSSRSAVLDQLGLPVAETLRLLCLAGLGEPRLWLGPASCLSAGQADRLALARVYAAAEGEMRNVECGMRNEKNRQADPRPARSLEGRGEIRNPAAQSEIRNPQSAIRNSVLLLIDEFGSRLDRLTAKVLAANFRRWLGSARHIAAVVATAHDDLADVLAPDRIWIKTAEAELREAVVSDRCPVKDERHWRLTTGH